METPAIRLIAYDLDGTMLNDEKQIPPGNLAALAAARARGVILMPATGRPLANVSPVVTAVPGVRYVLTSNGAAVWDLGSDPAAAVRSRRGDTQNTPAGTLPPDARCLALSPMDVDTARRVVAALRPFLPGNLHVFINGRTVSEPDSYHWEQTHRNVGFRSPAGMTTLVPDLDRCITAHAGQIEKVCMFFRDIATLQSARRALATLSAIEVVQSAPDNLEITAAGVDKGVGLKSACAALGIPIQAVLALGDSENDLGLLRDAGVAGVMANGTPEAKALADLISAADNNHCGAAELIYRCIPEADPRHTKSNT